MTAPRPITKVYAYIAVEDDGGAEGVCAASMQYMGQFTMMPLIGSDMDRMNSLRPYAEAVVAATGRPVKLVEFGSARVLELLDGATHKAQ